MAIPHNSISIGSQILGRSFLRNTLLGTCQHAVRLINFRREKETYLKERVREIKDR